MEHATAPRVYIGTYALCTDNTGRILLCRITPGFADQGRWTLPGGGLDWGEDPADGMRRELEEETGLCAITTEHTVATYSKVYDRTDDDETPPVHHIGLIFRVTSVAGDLRPEPNGSTDESAWFTPLEASQLPLVPLAQHALGIVQSSARKHGP